MSIFFSFAFFYTDPNHCSTVPPFLGWVQMSQYNTFVKSTLYLRQPWQVSLMYAGSKLEQITSTLIFSCERNFNDTVLAAQLNLEWEVHKVGPQGDNWLALFAAKPASPLDRQLTDTSLSLSRRYSSFCFAASALFGSLFTHCLQCSYCHAYNHCSEIEKHFILIWKNIFKRIPSRTSN